MFKRIFKYLFELAAEVKIYGKTYKNRAKYTVYFLPEINDFTPKNKSVFSSEKRKKYDDDKDRRNARDYRHDIRGNAYSFYR